MGATLPLVYIILGDVFNFGSLGKIFFTFIWMILAFYIPLIVVIIAFIGIACVDFHIFINHCKDNYNKELQKQETKVAYTGMSATDRYYPTHHKNISTSKKEPEYQLENLDDLEEFVCERCETPISEEEYNDNGGLCEDCYDEVYFGERYEGDDYDLYR